MVVKGGNGDAGRDAAAVPRKRRAVAEAKEGGGGDAERGVAAVPREQRAAAEAGEEVGGDAERDVAVEPPAPPLLPRLISPSSLPLSCAIPWPPLRGSSPSPLLPLSIRLLPLGGGGSGGGGAFGSPAPVTPTSPMA